MSTPWFTEAVAWLPGTLLGVLGGSCGAFAGVVLSSTEKRAKWAKLVVRGYWLVFSISLVLLASGVAALLAQQPYGVWYALLGPGVIGGSALGAQYFSISSRLRGAPPSDRHECNPGLP